jgi:hypothetical protein
MIVPGRTLTIADENPLPVKRTTVEPFGIRVVLLAREVCEDAWCPLWFDDAAAAGRASSTSPGRRVPNLKKLPVNSVAATMGRQRKNSVVRSR